ncbi:hypothetical protein [Desulfobacterium sp. N47]|uniref:Uncharacterized protein n=1 Tax=uncultured Desulfobacterium sp. TaxID=201089 RepID=E1YCX2_9BACT|nr:unknown protein [uncultured Desulfobacterium sp.]
MADLIIKLFVGIFTLIYFAGIAIIFITDVIFAIFCGIVGLVVVIIIWLCSLVSNKNQNK